MVLYSHSRLSTFEQCPLKFKFRYIDKLEPEIKQSIEGFLGNKVHDSLEFIYREACKGRTVELDELIEFYIQVWNKEYTNEIKVIKEELNAEHYFEKGVKFLIDYFTENYPFKDNTIAVEKQIIIDLDKENPGKYKLQGFIDRLVHNKDTNIFEIHDYKTGQIKTQEDLDKDRQLALYSLGIRESFPEAADIHLIWHFLDLNKKMSSRRTLEELNQLKQEIINLINKIESTSDFQANPGNLCKWCEFQGYCDSREE
jgi:putative RecB family exonuclease